jgi:hypothetical protein
MALSGIWGDPRRSTFEDHGLIFMKFDDTGEEMEKRELDG